MSRWDEETDVIIIGYGAAGAATAITARDASVEVTVLEKQPSDRVDNNGEVHEIRHTPNSRMSAGLILCPSNPEDAYSYQKRLNDAYGVDDVPEDMLRTWARMICENHEWLLSLGGGEEFLIAPEEGPNGLGGAEYPDFPGAGSTRRITNPRGGAGFFEFLDRHVGARGAKLHFDTPAMELIQDPDTNGILGVRAGRGSAAFLIQARKAVVLTCGGFEFSQQMKATYLRIPQCEFYGNRANTGDGVRMALKVGADLWHMNNMAAMATASWSDAPYSFRCTPWKRPLYGFSEYWDGKPMPQFDPSYSVIIVDRHGHRYTQEIYKLLYTFYWEMIHFDSDRAEFLRIPSHLIFDDKTRREGPIATMSGASGPLRLYEWSPDNRVEMAKNWIRTANTVGELADMIGVPRPNLEATVERWNQFCNDGRDRDFNRDPGTLVPIDTPPYHEVIQWPGSGSTQGGARRDGHARVLDPDGRPIPRLYSAGEFGSIYGFLYQGGGNLAECIAFGRIAGENAANEVPTTR